ncbi:hypothetical protein JSE7799_03261 [Jannaschia seosinensis]|uniref:Transposase n=1 Tax=Jannaschia seosinensis TaxID=313367 RepID=A0A0M7BCK1_9RHOB|nr:hypothetical protein JSE7799_03261 [Jannaschia seosinensis]
MKDTMIGVDLAKSVFQLHGASMAGHLEFRKKVTRVQFRQFMSKHEPAVVVMEDRATCGLEILLRAGHASWHSHLM